MRATVKLKLLQILSFRITVSLSLQVTNLRVLLDLLSAVLPKSQRSSHLGGKQMPILELERFSGILGECPNPAEVREGIYCNQKEFSNADRVKLVSSISKGPALNLWMEKIEGKQGLVETGVVFPHSNAALMRPVIRNKLNPLHFQ